MMTSKMSCNIRPPLCHRTKRIGAMGGPPINLWRNIVNRTRLQPCYRVRKDTIILPVTGYRTRFNAMLSCHRSRSTCSSCGRNTKLHAWTYILYHIIYISNHLIDISPTPVSHTQSSTWWEPQTIISCLAGNRNSVRIEIVIKYNPIYIILDSNLPTYIYNALAHRF